MSSLLSVIIPTYKRDLKLLDRAINSVLNQDYPSIEILIIDDNELVNKYSLQLKEYCNKDTSIRYFRQNGNKGACAARNLGIEHALGEYIGFLDDDDYWYPTKARKQIDMLLDDKSIGMSYCKGYQLSLIDGCYQRSDYYNVKYFKPYVSFEDLTTFDLIGTTSQAIIRKVCFEVCGCFDENLLARQDYEMWLRIAKYYKIVGVDYYLFDHYKHDKIQITSSLVNSLLSYEYVFNKYKNDFYHNELGILIILSTIIRLSFLNKRYLNTIKYLVLYVMINPLEIRRISHSLKHLNTYNNQNKEVSNDDR